MAVNPTLKQKGIQGDPSLVGNGLIAPVDPFSRLAMQDGISMAPKPIPIAVAPTPTSPDALHDISVLPKPATAPASAPAPAVDPQLFPALTRAQEMVTNNDNQPVINFSDPAASHVAAGPVDNTAPPPTPIVTPLNAQSMNGKARLQTLIDQAFSASPTDTVSDLSWKVRKRSDFEQKLTGLGDNFTAGDADAMFGSWYQTVAPIPRPFQNFSPEEQAALDAAYGGKIPGRIPLGASDINQPELGAVAGMLLGGLFHGGNASQVWPAITDVLQQAKQRNDFDNQNAQAQDQMRRQGALAQFHRLAGISDENFKQQGYEARDERTAERAADLAKAVALREQANKATDFKNQTALRYFDFLKAGDPARAAQVKAYAESQLGHPLDDSFNDLQNTVGQDQTVAQTDHTNADTDRINTMVEGMGIKNEVDKATMKDVIRSFHNKADLGDENVKKLKIELDALPETLDAKSKALIMTAKGALMRGQGALLRAQKYVPGGGKDPNQTRIANLKAVVGTFNTAVDNNARDLAKAKAEYVQWSEMDRKYLGNEGGGVHHNPEYVKNAQAAQAHADAISGHMAKDTTTLDQANEDLNKLVLGGGH
jgi:hypothetical protein